MQLLNFSLDVQLTANRVSFFFTYINLRANFKFSSLKVSVPASRKIDGGNISRTESLAIAGEISGCFRNS